MHLNGEKWEKGILSEKPARNKQMDRRFMFMKIFWPQEGCLPLPQGYIHVYDQNIQISFRKPFGQSKPNFMWSKIRMGE